MKCSVLHSQFYFSSDNWYFVKSPLHEDPSCTRNSASHEKQTNKTQNRLLKFLSFMVVEKPECID